MSFGPLLAAALLAAAPAPDSARSTPGVEHNAVTATAGAHPTQVPANGEAAPDFTYQSQDYLWQNLHNLLEQGNVLLVFGAGDADLRALEREREALLGQGVVPVAVVDRHDQEVWGLVRRLGLSYSLLADPHSAIGEQYGVLDPAAKRCEPAWFVIDTHGRVRESGQGALPARDWAARTATALGLPDAGAIRTASTH